MSIPIARYLELERQRVAREVANWKRQKEEDKEETKRRDATRLKRQAKSSPQERKQALSKGQTER